MIAVRRGNVDAIYQNSPEANERRADGKFTDAPLFAPSHFSDVPVAADFLGAGDFDADGHWDAVAAARGGDGLYLFRGDGSGAFVDPERISLPGAVTALETGDVNRRDGLTDLLVAVQGSDGARLLIFEHANGALRAGPESFELADAATSIATGQLDEDPETDMLVAAGGKLVMILGRDRRTSLDADSRAKVTSAKVRRLSLDSGVVSVAVGDFGGDYHEDIAVLLEEGTIQTLERDTETAAGTGSVSPAADEWRVNHAATVTLLYNAATGMARARLVKAKLSSLPTDDVVILDADNGRVHVITSEPNDPRPEAESPVGLTGRRRLATPIEVTGEAAAIIPMRVNQSALDGLIIFGGEGNSPTVISAPSAATLTVNSTLVTNARDAFLTLTEAVRVANGTLLISTLTAQERAQISGVPSNPGLDTINFSIPGGGVPTITDSNFEIPAISDPLTLDGTTQPAGKVAIVAARGSGGVLRIAAGNTTVRGLVLNGNCKGLQLAANGNNVIEGNFIGTSLDDMSTGAGNQCSQIQLDESSSNNTIGGTTGAARNIISGVDAATSSSNGVFINGPISTGNLIRGNYIGPNVTGNSLIGNRGHGVFIGNAASINNTIGGTTAGAGNVISGIGSDIIGGGHSAIRLQAPSQLIQVNIIGLNKDGTAALANSSAGIWIVSVATVTIGGTSPAARNVISGHSAGGNVSHGIIMGPYTTTNCLVQGNYIGTNITGTAAIRNAGHGILLAAAPGNTIGGAVAGARNLISGNILDGISLQRVPLGNPTDNQIMGNYIGTDITGTLAVGNQSDGIEIGEGLGGMGGLNLLVGGTTPSQRNLISGNRENGIHIRGDARANPNRFEGNYIGTNIFGTGALGNGNHGIFFPNNIAGGQNIGGTTA